MQNREFEKQVQGKMEELKFTPADAVWDKVEAGLPEEKKRRWLIFVLLFAAVTGGLLIWMNNNNTAGKKQPLGATDVSSNNLRDSGILNTGLVKPLSDTGFTKAKSDEILNTDNIDPAYKPAGKKAQSSALTRMKIKNGETWTADDDIANDGSDVKNHQLLRTKAMSKIKVKNPEQNDLQNENTTAPQNEVTASAKTNDVMDSDTASLKKEDRTVAKQQLEKDTATINKKDTAEFVKQKSQATSSQKKWRYGIELAAGTANIKSSLFDNTSVYANALGSSGGSTAGAFGNTAPNKPNSGLAFGIGIYAQKNINERWKFKTGISYLFQSYIIKVGSKVDSVANFSFDINKSIAASSYYRSGSNVSYKNKSHLLEIPLLFQYRFSKTSPFYAEAGPGVVYLLQSNALVYNSSSQAYVSDKNIYNKLSMVVNAGIGTTLAQRSRTPLTVGFMFKYGAGSLVKSSFGKQHLVNTLLYLRLPLKK